MDRVLVNQLTVDRLTGSYVNKIYGTERLRVVVQRLTGEQSCSQPVDGRQVDRLTGRQVEVDRLTGWQVGRSTG